MNQKLKKKREPGTKKIKGHELKYNMDNMKSPKWNKIILDMKTIKRKT